MASFTCSKKSLAVYRPRRPEKTVLFEIIKKHYNTWSRNTKEPIPKHVDNAFKKYLECGILAKGFAYARCQSCCNDFLIAFSCKGRGICPSCNTRAMVETAANLMENVIPIVPMRQWVISFPMRIRHYLKT
jgi:Transposase zinc-binding domain